MAFAKTNTGEKLKMTDTGQFYNQRGEYRPGGGPAVTSHGELMHCDVPMLPPSLSSPCLPLPATVMTVPFSRSILRNKQCVYTLISCQHHHSFIIILLSFVQKMCTHDNNIKIIHHWSNVSCYIYMHCCVIFCA